MQPGRPLHPAPGRQQQERSGRQHRQEHSRHSQSQRHGPQYNQQIIHDSNSRPKSNKNHLYRLLPAILSVLLSTTAANPAIRCRCGSHFPHAPSLQPLYGIFPPPPLSTTAAKPTFRCRCGSRFPHVPSPQAPVWHLSSVSPFHNGSKTLDSVPLRQLYFS